SNRSMNYTKIDHCQDNISIDNDDYYKQIIHSTKQRHSNQEIKLQIIVANRIHLILFIFLFLTCQTSSLPLYQTPSVNYNQQGLPAAMVQLSDGSVYPQQAYKVYRRIPNQQMNAIPMYSNAVAVQVQQPPTVVLQTPNQQQFTLQIRRERQRRAMIDRMVTLFDDDGNGQLTRDELYSMALRSNIFPKFHYYLKQTPI
ncbi:unnamed protein product, partial [Adineta ricciae]